MPEGAEHRRAARARGLAASARHRLQQVGHSLVWRAGPRLLPLPLALYTNRHYLAGPSTPPPDLPEVAWAFAEQQRLLERSEQRLQSIEAKGPGLATVCAVVAAGIGVAISLTWGDAGAIKRVLLVASAAYAVMSLAAPIQLVGPIERSTVTAAQLVDAARDPVPEASVARQCAQAAAANDRSTLRLSNLQAASRNDLVAATALFVAWAGAMLF